MFKNLLLVLLLSIWEAFLFLFHELGLNVVLFTVPLLILFIYILNKEGKVVNNNYLFLAGAIVLLSLTYFIFDNTYLLLINLLLIPLLFVLMLILIVNEKFNIKQLFEHMINVIFEPLSCVGNVKNVIKSNVKLIKKNKSKRSERTKNILIGTLIAIPLLILVIVLLCEADIMFAEIFSGVIDSVVKFISSLSFFKILMYSVNIILVFLYLGAVINYLMFDYKKMTDSDSKLVIKNDYAIKIILTSLNVIYVIFSFIQIKSLFVDVDNYAHYARTGFFQLIFVSIINFVIILLSKKTEKSKYITVMSTFMIAFTFIILVSSFVKMNSYVGEFGYTFSRIFVYFMLITECLLLVPTILYVLDKKVNLPKVYFVIIISSYMVLNYINVDYVIAKNNVDRYFEGKRFDLNYLISETGSDSTSQLIRLYNSGDKKYKYDLGICLKDRADAYRTTDIREFNISYYNTSEAIKKIKGSLNIYEADRW